MLKIENIFFVKIWNARIFIRCWWQSEGYIHSEVSSEILFFVKLKVIPSYPSITMHLGICLNEIERNYIEKSPHRFLEKLKAPLPPVGNNQDFLNRWLSKVWHEYYGELKRNVLSSQGKIRRILNGFLLLSDRSQSQKSVCCIFLPL